MPESHTFTSNLESLEAICDFVTNQAQSAGLDEAGIYAVQLAVDEAATNIIEHAYQSNNQGMIQCSCEILSDGLKIILHDEGLPFDPDSVPEPVVNVPLEELKPRGLGVFLIRKLMDEVKFDFTQKTGNTLIMIKRRT
jgi:serine/threonine-protein kinase RsbW